MSESLAVWCSNAGSTSVLWLRRSVGDLAGDSGFGGSFGGMPATLFLRGTRGGGVELGTITGDGGGM